jgi:hypothetical protein
MDSPRFTDVRGIERDLAGDPAYAKLGKAIRLSTLAQSCKSDVAQAASCCSTLRELLLSPRKRGTLERSTTENALLFTAVSLYGRATATVGKDQERGSINITAKLSADQLLDHTALVTLRNRGLAHVYDREIVSDEVWHTDSLFLVERPDGGWLPSAVSSRLQFDLRTLERLERQLPVAAAILLQRFHDGLALLQEVMRTEPVPLAVFEGNVFDPVPVFGSLAGVNAALNGIEKGHATGLLQGSPKP